MFHQMFHSLDSSERFKSERHNQENNTAAFTVLAHLLSTVFFVIDIGPMAKIKSHQTLLALHIIGANINKF